METQFTSGKASIEWTFVTQDVKNKGEWIESDALFITPMSDCKFYILARHHPGGPTKLEIMVRKSPHAWAEIPFITVLSEHGLNQRYSLKVTNWVTDEWLFSCREFVKGNSFKVICDITWYKPSLGLHNDVKSFLLNPTLSDFTIVIGGDELPVHKLILGARSSVFLAMFESDMRESKENKVTIEDIRLDVMKNVLSFLYTESEEALHDSQMVLDMWNVAEKYNIVKLKSLCEAKLFGLITESNVLEIFEHAVDHGPEKLRCACLKFIDDNKKKMADEPHFKTSFFKKPKLMYTLIYDLLLFQSKK